MKTSIKTLISATVLAASTGSVWADGTTAGTDIDNTASISYSVGGTAQTAIASSPTGNSTAGTAGTPTSFKVDEKIDLLVTAGSDVPVAPGSTGQVTTFTFRNQGNSARDFDFVGSQVAAGDNFNTTSCVTAPTSLSALAPDTNQSITVTCNIPPTSNTAVVNGATSKIDLNATTTATETVGPDTANVDIVFADDTGVGSDGASRNATHSAVNTFIVGSAQLTVTKTSAVTDDTINSPADAKRIPGATIVYTITVANAASTSTAQDIVLTDVVPNTLTLASAPTIAITGGNGGTASVTSGTNNSVATAAFDLDAGETATLTITATVN